MFKIEDRLLSSGWRLWADGCDTAGTCLAIGYPCHTSREDRQGGSAQLSAHYLCSEAARSAKK